MDEQDLKRVSELLELWFGEVGDDGNVVKDRSELWWKKKPETDAMLRERFGADVGAAASGERDRWATDPEGCLALILCLDQLPRNIHRDSPLAFAHDEKARRLSLSGMERGLDRELPLIQRVFFYMPLEHAEDRELQRRSVALFTSLAQQAPEHARKAFEAYLDYARRHQAIVERFGRFPHRNAILGRESTPEELAFLEQPGSSF